MKKLRIYSLIFSCNEQTKKKKTKKTLEWFRESHLMNDLGKQKRTLDTLV